MAFDKKDEAAYVTAMRAAQTPEDMCAAFMQGLRDDEAEAFDLAELQLQALLKGTFYSGMAAALFLIEKHGAETAEEMIVATGVSHMTPGRVM